MNQTLSKVALTHRSALNENKNLASNERLEFLGDAVLELAVSEWLYRRNPDYPEGQLSRERSLLVQTKTLAQAAKNMGLDRRLIMSRGEDKGGGRKNESILADCFEAVIGALYLEKGWPAAVKFIDNHLLNLRPEPNDYKSELQEKWQKRWHTAPVYRLLKTRGPDHQKIFTVGVYRRQQLQGTGSGRSKQTAEADAAKKALALSQ